MFHKLIKFILRLPNLIVLKVTQCTLIQRNPNNGLLHRYAAIFWKHIARKLKKRWQQQVEKLDKFLHLSHRSNEKIIVNDIFFCFLECLLASMHPTLDPRPTEVRDLQPKTFRVALLPALRNTLIECFPTLLLLLYWFQTICVVAFTGTVGIIVVVFLIKVEGVVVRYEALQRVPNQINVELRNNKKSI